jgi:hypothetical protein
LKAFLRIPKRGERRPSTREDGLKSVALDEVEQLPFAGEIIVKAGQAHAGRAGYVADRRTIVSPRAKGLRCPPQDAVELAVELDGIAIGNEFALLNANSGLLVTKCRAFRSNVRSKIL